MKRLILSLLLLLGTAFAATQPAQRVAAADCYFQGVLSPQCSGTCMVLYFGTDQGCAPNQVNLQRRVVGTSTWATVSTNITSPHTYCPPPSLDTYEYRLVLKCQCGSIKYFNYGTITCP